MDEITLYKKIQQAVYKPVRKVSSKLNELADLDICYERDDVIQDFYLYLSSRSVNDFELWGLENELHNWLRRKITKSRWRKNLIPEIELKCPLDELRAPELNDKVFAYDHLLGDVLALHILDQIDLEVLSGQCSRKVAAIRKDKKYEAYKKELQRKLFRIRQKLKRGR